MEDIAPLRVLPVYPPSEIEHEFVENPFQKGNIPLLVISTLHLLFAIYLKNPPRCPRMDGRIHIPEGPLVSRQLAIRVHVPLPSHEDELSLGELRVYESKGDRMKCEIPGRVPRIFPFVWHREDIVTIEVLPFEISTT